MVAVKFGWFSEFEPTDAYLQTIKLRYPNQQVDLVHNKIFSNAPEVIAALRGGNYDGFFIRSSHRVISELHEAGYHPLWQQIHRLKS